MLVVDADGSWRACEFARRSLRVPSDCSWSEAWESSDVRGLRSALGAFELPCDHCGGCAALAEDSGAFAWAPAVADYGRSDGSPLDQAPRHLTLRLPSVGTMPAGPLESLESLLPELQSITIDCDSLPGDRAELRWLRSRREAAPELLLHLRVRKLGDASAVLAACAGLRVGEVELVVDTPTDPEMAALRQLGVSLGARARVRFVLRPENWFDFERAAQCASRCGLPLEWRFVDYDGRSPLSSLDHEQLSLVKTLVASAWRRFQGEARPASVDEGSFFFLVDGLRRLLEQRLQASIGQDGAPGPASKAPLRMPPFDHPWFSVEELGAGAIEAWLSVSSDPTFAEWFHAELRTGSVAASMRTNALVRLLCQKLTAEHSWPEGCEALASLYRSAKSRARLVAADDSLVANFDLRAFDGPWLHRLGIDEPQRKRPFSIGKPREPREGSVADCTVLVPSYGHGAYVQETIRSVLAQTYTAFRLLVVDDCSKDDTVAKAREIQDPRLEVRVNETNLGLGDSILAALATVDTPFLALLNSDDLFHPNRLQRCLEKLQQDREIQLVTTAMSLVDSKGGQLTPDNVSLVFDGRRVCDWVQWYDRESPRQEVPKDQLFGALLERNFLATSSNLVVRTDWLRAQAERLRGLKYCLDWQLFLDAARQQVHCHVPEPLVAYRLHPDNTVWFRGGRRWSFFMEVNRVVAGALVAAVAEIEDPTARLARLLELVSRHVLRNREADGIALFVSSVATSSDFDRCAAADPRIGEALLSLEAAAANSLRLRDDADEAAEDGRRLGSKLRAALDAVARELLVGERSRADGLQSYADSLEARLRTSYADAQHIENERGRLARELGEATARLAESQRTEASARQLVADQQARAQALHQDLEAARSQLALVAELRSLVLGELAATRKALEAARGESEALRGTRDQLTQRVEDLQRQLDAVQSQHDQLLAQCDELVRRADRRESEVAEQRAAAEAELGALKTDLDAAAASHALTRSELAAVESQRDATRLDLERVKSEAEHWRTEFEASQSKATDLGTRLAAESEQLAASKQTIERLEKQRAALAQSESKGLERITALEKSREYRIGSFFWNTLPLSFMARRGKKWFNRIVDSKNRLSLWLGAKFGRHKAEGVAVVASCWHWPIYSHTFVYQEMIGLTHMGLDVRMFHWADNDASELQPAFSYLASHRTQIKPVWENHFRDKEHFEKTKPGRLRALLERISAVTGQTVEELEANHFVIQACTFARMAELAGARYIHTYFFYDQTFMGLVASWLLEIPRGISCYADHMLDDFPFKMVGLQIELADVVVATSARIKQELSAKSGGRFDDRIVVKPNGVDGARFPIMERPVREPGGLFEVISVSRIEPKKGLIHLTEAIAILKSRGHKVVAHVIGAHDPHSKGSLEYLNDLKARIEELGVEKEVILHGMKMQEEIRPILQRSRAFVSPYVELATGDKDGIPTAMLEAMAAQLPVVTTDSGSILEVVDDGVEALVVPQRDSKAFAAALERLITDPELERRLSRAARQRFDRQFDIKVTERVFHARVAALLAERAASSA